MVKEIVCNWIEEGRYALKPMIVVRGNAAPLEIFSAGEVQKYVRELTGCRLRIVKDVQVKIDQQPLILIGNIRTNRLISQIARQTGIQGLLHGLKPQEFILKSITRKNNYILLVSGGDAAGTMYAAYELLERYGIQFHTIGDIFPEGKTRFRLPDIDIRMSPVVKKRGFSTFLNFLEGPASWGLNEYKQYIDQMAKMKFNFFTFYSYAFAPWLDFDYRGVKNVPENPDYGQRFSITKDLMGWRHLGNGGEFNSPVLAGIREPHKMFENAQSLIRQVIEYAHQRGIEVGVSMELNELPEDIKKNMDKLKEWSKKPNPDWQDVTDPVIQDIMAGRFRKIVKRYPDADAYFMYQLEGRSACQNNNDCQGLLNVYERRLNARCLYRFPYTVEPVRKIRLTRYLQADIEYIHLFNKLFIENKSLKRLIRKDARIVMATWFTQPTFPVISSLLPEDMVFSCILDYGASETIKHMKYLRYFKNKPFQKWLISWIESDCISWFPQFAVQSVYQTLKEANKYSLDGIILLFWRLHGLEHNTRYFSRVVWDLTYTPDKFYEEYLPVMFGKNCEKLKDVFYSLEKEQPLLVNKLVNIAFPHKRVLLDYMDPSKFDIRDIERAKSNFSKALKVFKESLKKAKGSQKRRVRYYINKFTFCIQYLESVKDVLEAKDKLRGYQQNSEFCDRQTFRKNGREVLQLMEGAMKKARECILTFSRDVLDRGEKGALVKLNYFLYHGIKETKKEMEERIRIERRFDDGEEGEYYPTLVKEE